MLKTSNVGVFLIIYIVQGFQTIHAKHFHNARYSENVGKIDLNWFDNGCFPNQ